MLVAAPKNTCFQAKESVGVLVPRPIQSELVGFDVPMPGAGARSFQGQTQTFFATSATPAGARYSEYRIGGTSLSSPIMAGIFALANQARSASGTAELGFANPMLYSLNGSSAVTDIVDPASTVAAVRINYNNGEDATSGTSVRLRTMNQTLSLHTTPGWDDVTGIGTPTSTFVGALSK